MTEKKSQCLFCRISSGQEENTKILYDQDDIVIFKDIHPAASHHYLVVPKVHINSAKHLTSTDIPLLEKLVSHGTQFLEQQGGDIKDSRMGFHWPPFHTVAHIHLHVISPQNEMGWIARCIFKPGSWWFKTPDWVLQQVRDSNVSK